MDIDNNTQPSTAMMPVPERFARATTNPLSPSDLMISLLGSPPVGQEPAAASTIALARINRLPLLHWLLAAINDALDGTAHVQPRPAGTLLECGRCVASGSDVWAFDWYGHGRRCLLARCPNMSTAEELASRLNRLLRP